MKTCDTCGEAKALDAFPADGRTKDGHSKTCEACSTVAARRCNVCDVVKPIEAFAANAGEKSGRGYTCKACKADKQREYHAGVAPEDKAEAAKAFRAGIRQGKCAICADAISGTGICSRCKAAVHVLGGLEGLKQAVRAVRYLERE